MDQAAILISQYLASLEMLKQTTLELQIYSIRHLMQHTGELMERLGARTGADIAWVGSMHG